MSDGRAGFGGGQVVLGLVWKRARLEVGLAADGVEGLQLRPANPAFRSDWARGTLLVRGCGVVATRRVDVLLCGGVEGGVMASRGGAAWSRGPREGGCSPTGSLAVLATGPAAGPALAFFQLLPGPVNAALSRHRLLRVLDPADELVARQGGDVPPGSERRGAREQRLPQVFRELVHHPAGYALAGHGGE